MKPSQLLQKLRSLATSDISSNLIKTLWLEKLPDSMRNILLVSDEDVSKLASMADKIMDMTFSPDVCEASSSQTSHNVMENLLEKISSLEKQVAEINLSRSRPSFRTQRQRSRSSSRIRRKYDPNGSFCYYHFRFGARCIPEKCKPPFNGADVSIVPPNKNEKRKSDYKLYAANGSEIETYGVKILTLDLGLRREFQWPFVVAKVNKGILGADFLNKFNLLIDINKRKLIDGITNLAINGVITSITENNNIVTLCNNVNFSKLLSNYPNITKPALFPTKPEHDVKHFIVTEGPPVHSKARQLDHKRLAIAKQEFKFMLENDIIRTSKSHWASPLHMVAKKDGSFRLCGDYRQLNAKTVTDRYPIPRIEDFHHILKDAKIFSKIDLLKAYFQIPIEEKDKCKTAVITPFGLFEYNVMNFGLKNAPSSFQRFIHEVLWGLDFVFPYLDDILIASASEVEHSRHLKIIFERLNKYGLKINVSKSIFGVTELNFLGYLVTPEGSKPLPDKKSEKATPRQLRQLQFISQFSTDIRHIKGQDNIVADALSRIEELTLLDYDEIAERQKNDEELRNLQSTSKSLNFKQYPLSSGKYLWCDTSTNHIRPYIPESFRFRMFQQIHGLSHPGIRSTVKQMSSKFIWTSIKKDVQQWSRCCIPCQKNKVTRHTKSNIGEFQDPMERFTEVHIDLVGPLPPSNGNTYCLTCIDRFSNWMEVVPLENISAERVARAFYENWISRFGTPHRLISDRGAQFTSETFKCLSRLCGFKLQHTTAYHPQCNVTPEDFNLFNHDNLAWSETLPTVLLGLRTALQEDTNLTIAKMVYGQNIRLPGEFFCETKILPSSETFANKLQKQIRSRRLQGLVPQENIAMIKQETQTKMGEYHFQPFRNPSIFTGERNQNPEKWLKEFHRVARYNCWDDSMCLANVYFFLQGTAHRWYENVEEKINSWDIFVKMFSQNFGHHVAQKDQLAENLKTRAQGKEETSDSYIQDILHLCREVNPAMMENEIVAHLTKGISEEIYQSIIILDIASIDEFIKWCRKIEASNKKRVKKRVVFDRLPNVAAIDSADSESMEDLIRRIVREEVHRALNPESTTPVPSSLKEIIREEIEKNVAAISKPIQRPPPRQSYPNQTRTFNQVPRRQYPTQTPIYNQTPPQRRTDEWRTHDNIPICFNCGRPGHVKRYCRERRQWTQRPEGLAPSTQEPQMGSSFSVISDGLRRQLKKTMFKDSGMTLKVADGKNVTSIGRCTISLSISGLEQPLEFIVLPNSNPSIILGWDFLEASNAVIDCGRAEIRLEEAKDVLNSPASMGKVVASRSVVIPAESTKLINVMSEELNGQNQQTSLAKHKIETGNHQPIKHRPYRVSPTERQAIQTEVDKMLDAGIIRHSESPWSSPVILVKKKDGNWRFCVDYRRLNKVTKKDVYPLPRIDDTLDSLKGAKFYSSMDLRSGYWQIEVDEADREKTAFITPDGLYEFLVMLFGLCNAPSTFERMMDKILKGLKWTMAVCYLDDIVVYSKSFNEHLHRLEIILQCLDKAELRLNPKKCLFGTKRIRVFGHLVDSKDIYPDPEKIEAIAKFPTPKSITDVRSFIGLCSYYRRFIENFAEKAAPLHEVLKKDNKLMWNSDQQDAFDSLKKALMSEPVLAYFEEQLPTELHTDTSGYGIGAVLVQINDGKERPVGYASRTLSKAEKNYSTTERECLAAIWAINKFRPYLFGREFVIVTDHHALCWLSNLKDPTGRLARWALKLQEYNVTVVYKSGRKHQDADCLSRNPLQLESEEAYNDEDDDIPSITALTCFEAEQRKDPKICKLIEEKGRFGAESKGYEMLKGTLYKKNFDPLGNQHLLVIPKHLRLELLKSLHDAPTAGHLGFSKTYERVKNKYFWPGLLRDIRKYVAHCKECQRKKQSTQKPPGLLKAIPPATSPFQRVGMDLLGRFPKSDNGNKWIIVCTDYLTRFAVTKALSTGEAKEAAKFLMEDVVLKHGAPREIITDRGRVFQSKLIAELTNQCSSIHRFTTAYHPQTNGLTERLNKTLANMIAMYVSVEQKDWDVILPYVTFAYNTAKQDTTGFTPFKLIHGREAETTVDTLFPNPHEDLQEDYSQKIASRVEETRQLARLETLKAQEKDKARYDSKHEAMDYNVGDLVWIFIPIRTVGLSEKLMKRYFGPYRVTRKLSDVTFEVEPVDQPTRRRKTRDLVHVLRMKPYHDPEDQADLFNRFLNLKYNDNNDLEQYFKEKSALANKLNLEKTLLLEALTDGMPDHLKKYIIAARVQEPSEWYKITTQLKLSTNKEEEPQQPSTSTSTPVKRFNSNSSKAHQYQPFPRTAAATHHQQEPHKSINQPPYPCKICASHQLPNQIHFHRDCPLKNNNHPKRINPGRTLLLFSVFINQISLPCVLDTASSISIIPLKYLNHIHYKILDNSPKERIGQVEGFTYPLYKILVRLSLGKITKYQEMFVCDSPIEYLILGLPTFHLFKLQIDFSKNLLFQNYKFLYSFNPKTDNQKSYATTLCIPDPYYVKNSSLLNINPLCNFNSFDMPTTNVKLIDPNSNPIIDSNSFHSMRQPGSITNYNSYLDLSKVDINPNFSNQTISDILHKYKNVFSKHNFDIGHIKTNPICISLLDNIPIAQKPYRTSFYNNAEIQKQITELLKYDIIRPSSSPYSSPALLVNKKSDNPNHPTRLCIDYRKLNQKTVPEHTPIPLIEQIIDRLSQSKIYTILDVKNAYWHIPIDEKDRHKTSFVTQLGCYEWNRLPYGLKNAPSQFERIMKSVFTKHNIHYALNYFDDIIIHSKTYEEHIKHLDDILGLNNIEADMLSRAPVSFYLTYNELKEHQSTEQISSAKIKIQNGLYIINRKGFKRAYVPQTLRHKLLSKVHTKHGHIGTTQMTKIISPHYYWPHMSRDIANYTKHCETCQFNKSRDNRIVYGPLQQMPIATHPNHIFSLDTLGGLHNYGTTRHSIHMIVDHHSRFLWAFPTKSVSTDSYITCLRNLFQINKPEILITDRNAAFLSRKFKHFLDRNNVKHLLTSSHHPETNAKVERLNSTIINRLRCEYNANLKIPWTKYIPKITESYNETVHTTTGFTPKFLYYGIQPQYIEHDTETHTPIEKARKLAIERTIKSHEHSKQLYDIKHPEPIFKEGDQVLVKTFIYPNTGKLTQRYIGPFTILKQLSPVTYEIDKPNIPQRKQTEIIHSNKLKLFYPETDFLLHYSTNIENDFIIRIHFAYGLNGVSVFLDTFLTTIVGSLSV
ncbi:hypothetical protein LAZ67_14002807, partial [Cordylochernes scorpioides]